MNKVESNKKYTQDENNTSFPPMKPKGMWYALGGAWNEFLKYWDHKYEYQNVFYVDIDYTNILRINTAEKFKKFVEIYDLSSNNQHGTSPQISSARRTKSGDFIDWIRVSQDYKGIEIIPMRYEFRHDYFWFSSWDIPSGCIWDTSAIKTFVKVYPK